MSLSERQAAAVGAARGGLFVSAAAGSGKTRVLTARFVRLVEEARGAGTAQPLDSVVAITFTEKAAGELAQRVRGTLAREVGVDVARDADGAWISTIHGLCRRLLKRHAFEAGLDPAFGVCDEVESALLRQRAFESAIRALSGSSEVERLLADYDVAELEEGVRTVDEHVRSLGLGLDVLGIPEVDLAPAVEAARVELRSLLAEMLALADRRGTEESNIAALADLLGSLESIDGHDPEAGAAVLACTAAFKQSKACRACAKPFALAAEDRVSALAEVAAGQASAGYAFGFLELLRRYSHGYEAAKAEAAQLDFEDLQLRTRDLLVHHPELVSRYRRGLVEVMVDEFQDTNELQLSVVSTLAGDILTTVGDEKQSIYGWRNADIGVFRRRRDEVEGPRVFSLPENYRSHPDLVSFYNELFSAEPFWPDDFMRLEAGRHEAPEGRADACAWPDSAPRVQLTLLDAEECSDVGKTRAEAAAVAEWFSALRSDGVRQKDLVLLLRAMKRAEEFEEALRDRGFDVFVASGGTFFDAPEIEELESLLRVVANTRDDEAFARVLAGMMANVSDDSLYLLRKAAASHQGEKRSLWEAATSDDRPELAPEDETALARAIDAISDVRRDRGRTSLYDLVHSACEKLGYDLTLFAADRRRAWANVLKFARLASEFERLAPGDPGAFLDHLDQRRRHQRYEQQAAIAAEGVDAVRIMSVHSAKGLEFPVVALAELGGRGPDRRSTFECGDPNGELALGLRLPADEPFTGCRETAQWKAIREWRAVRELDEAKRVLYVACTRATEALGLFGVTDMGKEPREDVPVGWVIRAIGTASEGGLAAGEGSTDLPSRDIRVGDARVHVRYPAPVQQCEDEAPDTGGSVSPVELASGPSVAVRQAPHAEPSEPSPARPARISYTGLQMYGDCSYRYYATYVARLGRFAEAGGPGDPRSLGAAVHQALRFADPDTGISQERLRAFAHSHGLDDAGFERMTEAVTRSLAIPLVRTVLSAPKVLREVPFGVDIGGTTVDGVMDVLAVENDSAVVIDYKTGTSLPDTDAVERWRLQSVCYAIAVFAAFPEVERAEVVFIKPESDGHEERFSYVRDEQPVLECEVDGIVARIAGGSFTPLERYDYATCRDCPALGSLCPVTPESAHASV